MTILHVSVLLLLYIIKIWEKIINMSDKHTQKWMSKLRSDRRVLAGYSFNLSNKYNCLLEKPQKLRLLQWDSNPWSLQCGYNTLPTLLWSHLAGSRANGSVRCFNSQIYKLYHLGRFRFGLTCINNVGPIYTLPFDHFSIYCYLCPLLFLKY